MYITHIVVYNSGNSQKFNFKTLKQSNVAIKNAIALNNTFHTIDHIDIIRTNDRTPIDHLLFHN